jgi:hypothetical protein
VTLKFKSQESKKKKQVCKAHKQQSSSSSSTLSKSNICNPFGKKAPASASNANKSLSNSNKTIFVGSSNTLTGLDNVNNVSNTNVASVNNASTGGMKQSSSSKTLSSFRSPTSTDLANNSASKDCVYCIAENNNNANKTSIEEFSEFQVDRERLYNEQSYTMFKYHIIMCSLIFFGIAIALLITDLRK